MTCAVRPSTGSPVRNINLHSLGQSTSLSSRSLHVKVLQKAVEDGEMLKYEKGHPFERAQHLNKHGLDVLAYANVICLVGGSFVFDEELRQHGMCMGAVVDEFVDPRQFRQNLWIIQSPR